MQAHTYMPKFLFKIKHPDAVIVGFISLFQKSKSVKEFFGT